jgi:hypothetical protein
LRTRLDKKSTSLGVTVGTKIARSVRSNQNIATVPATCHPLAACVREIRYVTHNGAGPHASFNPSWSPDGQRIAFTQALFRTGKPPMGDIWTIRPDGRDQSKVSRSPRFDFRPDWGR